MTNAHYDYKFSLTALELSILRQLKIRGETTPTKLADAVRRLGGPYTDSEISSAIWSLIDSDHVDLTDDRKLRLSKRSVASI